MFAAVSLMVGLAVSALGQEFDLVLRGGRVIDGTGNPAFFADVAIKEGRIAAVGRIEGRGAREVRADGMVVAPGFIDVHTHAENIQRMPLGENFLRMGVTTLVLGNCGGSELDIREYLRKLEGGGISPNVCTLIGHNTVRREAMGGSFDREPTPSEMAKMKELVDRAMGDGAVGLSTGLIYLPGTFSKTDEIVELARVAAAYDGIYASHMRSEGNAIFRALEELFTVAREAKIRAQISHIKLSGNAMWGRAAEVLDAIERARAEGLDITQDQYAYTASSTGISALIPSWAREGTAEDYRRRITDSQERARIVQAMKDGLKASGRAGYGYAVVASYSRDRSFNGKRVPEIARERTGRDDLDAQIDLVLEIHANGGASGVFHGMSEEDLRRFMLHPNTMVASDSGVRDQGESVPHPRGYGNNARVLGRYVREEGVLRLEDAVRRMTSLPAQAFRLRDRGQVAEGFWADLVVFDPARVSDPSQYDDPHHFSVGFEWVLVNGVPVVEKDRHLGERPGKALRHLRG
jgi:N-acyl-D-amino-acid deacylase